jgi:ankyrin repeat protein
MNPQRTSSESDLITAVRLGSLDATRRALAGNANPNMLDPESGLTPLMLAAGAGAPDIARLLVEAGALVNAVDRRAGATALHKACQGGHLAVVKLLVEAGAHIDLQATTTGHTPLVEAIWFKSDDIVAYLIDRNARIELKTYYGFTIDDHINYAVAVSKGQDDQRRLARIKELVAQRRARDDRAREAAPLLAAVQKKSLDELAAALRAGAKTEERYPIVGSFDDGHTPLLVAARNGETEMVRALLQAGADVNAVEPVFGAVPLHKATYNGHLGITRLLAAAPGVNLDYQGPSNGYTPLADALWHGFADCAAALIDAGARADIVGYDGKLAADLAAEKLGADHPLTQRLRSPARPREGHANSR